MSSVIGKPVLLFGEPKEYAHIVVTYPAGSICTCMMDEKILTAGDTSGEWTFNVDIVGSWTVTASDGNNSKSEIVDVTAINTTYTIELEYLILESFATISETDFVKLIQAAHSGKVDLQQDAGWSVGDKRTISISAFTGGGNVSHVAQNIDIVISSFANYENCGCVMQFDFADALVTGNRMNASNTNGLGYDGSEMYKTTLPALVNSLPAYLRGLLIEFSCKASAGNRYTTIKTVTGNKLAFRSEVEIFGTTTYSAAGEGSQIPYYTTTANRIKKRGHSGSANFWWERSPCASKATTFCLVGSYGNVGNGNASNALGVAPFGCI